MDRTACNGRQHEAWLQLWVLFSLGPWIDRHHLYRMCSCKGSIFDTQLSWIHEGNGDRGMRGTLTLVRGRF